MESVIKEMYHGTFRGIEHVSLGEQYKEFLGEAARLRKLLTKQLSDEQTGLLDDLCDALDGLNAESAEMYYVEGVKVGMRLCLEASK